MTHTEHDLRDVLKLLEHLAPDLTAEHPSGPPRRGRGWVKPWASVAAAVLLIAAITAASLILSRHRSAEPAAPNKHSQVFNFDGLILRYPATWREVPVTWASTGPGGPVGFLTDAKTGPECNTYGCGAPVRTLGRNQVLVIVAESRFGIPPSTKANTTVAGFPAVIRTTSPPLGCPHGTRTEQNLTIAIPWQSGTGTERSMSLIACAAGPDTGAFQQLLRTATFTYPNTGPAAIHGTVTTNRIARASGGQPVHIPVTGNLLIYTNAAHQGIGSGNSPLTSTGTYNVGVGPGTYYLVISRPDGTTCDSDPVVATSNHDVRADITCASK